MASVDGSRSLQGTSDEFHTNICGPCKTDDVEKGAYHYCNDCSAHLCDHCKDYHRKIPLLKNHRIVFGSHVPAVISTRGQRAIVVYCTCNKNQEVQYFCDDHQDTACDSCKHTKHYKCKVSCIQDKSTNYTRSRIDAIILKIEALKADYEKLEETRNYESKRLERSKEDCKQEIKAFRKEIDTFLDDLEKTMLRQLESCENEGQNRIRQHISTLTATLKMLESDYKLLGDAKNDGRKAVMFAADVQVSNDLHDCDDRLSDIDSDVIKTDITFERNKRLANLQTEIYSLGSLIRNSTRKLQRERKSLLDNKIQSRKLVNLKLSDDSSKPHISGLAVMPTGDIVLCDWSNSKLKLLDSSDAFKDGLKLKANPWDISVVDAKTVIVTLPWIKQLQYIEVFPQLAPERVLQLDKPCWGVHVTGDKILISCHKNPGEGDVRILGLDGNLLQQLGINQDGSFLFTRPYFITVSPSEKKIYVSDSDKRTITCMTMDNRLIHLYRDNEIKGSGGVYCDGADNILVCGKNSNSVQVITAAGKKHGDLVASREGLQKPLSINYRETDDTLLVSGGDQDHVFLFKLG